MEQKFLVIYSALGKLPRKKNRPNGNRVEKIVNKFTVVVAKNLSEVSENALREVKLIFAINQPEQWSNHSVEVYICSEFLNQIFQSEGSLPDVVEAEFKQQLDQSVCDYIKQYWSEHRRFILGPSLKMGDRLSTGFSKEDLARLARFVQTSIGSNEEASKKLNSVVFDFGKKYGREIVEARIFNIMFRFFEETLKGGVASEDSVDAVNL